VGGTRSPVTVVDLMTPLPTDTGTLARVKTYNSVSKFHSPCFNTRLILAISALYICGVYGPPGVLYQTE
jgi:hypothetical protein